VVIALQLVYEALSDRIGRRPLNIFSVVFTAAFAFPYFLLLRTEQPVLVVLALIVATAFGVAPMIAVQPAFYAAVRRGCATPASAPPGRSAQPWPGSPRS
jgi:MFS transporter, MHS family, shikimate and dehydroshikimate transport protein